MEKIEITIETVNAAFEEQPASEIARILRRLADRFEHDGIIPDGLPLRDINGNTCGRIWITPDA